jgi:hypothetical protein
MEMDQKEGHSHAGTKWLGWRGNQGYQMYAVRVKNGLNMGFI